MSSYFLQKHGLGDICSSFPQPSAPLFCGAVKSQSWSSSRSSKFALSSVFYYFRRHLVAVRMTPHGLKPRTSPLKMSTHVLAVPSQSEVCNDRDVFLSQRGFRNGRGFGALYMLLRKTRCHPTTGSWVGKQFFSCSPSSLRA